MAAETENKSFFAKLTDSVRALVGKFTSKGEGQERLNDVKEKAGQTADKIAARADKLKGHMPEGVDKALKNAHEKADKVIGKFTKDMDPAKVAKMKEGGLMVGGAAATVDGVRRIAKKDENGKRHVVKGALEATAGVGMFTAAVLARRNGVSNDGPER